jgi:hypothetical protein
VLRTSPSSTCATSTKFPTLSRCILYDPVTLMFFFRNKHMMCDFGTGNNNKLNWLLEDKQELIDIIETIYRGVKKGRGLVVSPKGELNFCPPSGTEG